MRLYTSICSGIRCGNYFSPDASGLRRTASSLHSRLRFGKSGMRGTRAPRASYHANACASGDCFRAVAITAFPRNNVIEPGLRSNPPDEQNEFAPLALKHRESTEAEATRSGKNMPTTAGTTSIILGANTRRATAICALPSVPLVSKVRAGPAGHLPVHMTRSSLSAATPPTTIVTPMQAPLMGNNENL
ncbi:hypothetical protein BU26DRAFT_216350 [Trematosphaeria pertusa]|uniref:Uncharacterized protein n=1 Tax=Trematosphaeria pertusa TaxID=390896 RepID=A0A6A6IRH0_9PLEO|nr:uncharacterized protein BU26DRAFT_216350 [Trematosphaeria pertusa]KAF2253155.1 hypothetical protein BU26DRAFT_216350 [Trematosphaeria pertusa]